MFKKLHDESARRVRVTIDGQEVRVRAGETVAAAALIHGLLPLRTSAISGAPRGPYCMMGACFDCLVEIDGTPNRQACQVRVAAGMAIRRQDGAGGTAR
jgi:predicted molibdopterin-dependent oxidoreductase YjgC